MIKVIQLNVHGFDNNFSYIVFNENSKECIIIDPTGELKIIQSALETNNIKVKTILLTHSHPDHCELFDYFKSIGINSFVPKEGFVGQVEEILVAGINVKVIHVPGHTKESVCFLIENNLFSGDTLFVRGVGTTDYGGNDSELGLSLAFLSTLDKKIVLWPGHDYGGTKAFLGEALNNSHIKPSEKTLEKIKKKVEEYEKKF
jgi:glyoxylase-like metal-dependent hydrolase (beta-lactamase superfamily II)